MIINDQDSNSGVFHKTTQPTNCAIKPVMHDNANTHISANTAYAPAICKDKFNREASNSIRLITTKRKVSLLTLSLLIVIFPSQNYISTSIVAGFLCFLAACN